MDDDAGLLVRTRQGNEAAFALLFARHQRAIHLFASKMCGADDGDDVVQESLEPPMDLFVVPPDYTIREMDAVRGQAGQEDGARHQGAANK